MKVGNISCILLNLRHFTQISPFRTQNVHLKKKIIFIRFSIVVNVDYFKRSPRLPPSYWTDNDKQSIQCQTDTSCAYRMPQLHSIYQDKENVFRSSNIIALFLNFPLITIMKAGFAILYLSDVT